MWVKKRKANVDVDRNKQEKGVGVHPCGSGVTRNGREMMKRRKKILCIIGRDIYLMIHVHSTCILIGLIIFQLELLH